MSATSRRALGTALLRIARQAISQGLGGATPNFFQVVTEGNPRGMTGENPPETADATIDAALNTPGACFVTLTLRNRLRGCIGTLEAHRPLRDDVHENALAAAFRDPRFAPLRADEWPEVRIEISLLSAPKPLSVQSEADLIARLRPGIDGVIFQVGTRRATFLPQVWDDLPDPTDFLAHLKEKAGLPANYWSDAVRIETYTVEHWAES